MHKAEDSGCCEKFRGRERGHRVEEIEVEGLNPRTSRKVEEEKYACQLASLLASTFRRVSHMSRKTRNALIPTGSFLG